jgi:hypothetical protein
LPKSVIFLPSFLPEKDIETIIYLLKEESKMIISLIKKTRKLITVPRSPFPIPAAETVDLA